jgi:phosphoserine phosphatase
MPSKGMSEFAIRWHHVRRNQRLESASGHFFDRLEESFVVDLLESTTPDLVTKTLKGLPEDAISTIRRHLQKERPAYWAEIRYHDYHYEFDSGSPEELARQERFAATVSTILATTS